MSDARPGPFLAIAGPTGVGKTELSILIAQRTGAEIISADSRQMYRQLEIGVGKPSADELGAIPHHFISEREIGDPSTAGRFAEEANERIREILSRESSPLIVGGSTLYLDALIHGIADIPPGAPEIRAELNREAASPEGAKKLFEELQHVDPEGAQTLDATKTQRLVRALEVHRTTGIPWSSFLDAKKTPPFRYRVIVLTRPREELYLRINARVDAMLEAGLVDENMALIGAGFDLDDIPLRTIGYKEPSAYLSGEIDYDEMVRLLKRNTRRYAKRQLTWFRHHSEYEWLDLSAFSSIEAAADEVLALST